MQTNYALVVVSAASFVTALVAAGKALLTAGGISATDAAVLLLAVAVCVLALRLAAAEKKLARLSGEEREDGAGYADGGNGADEAPPEQKE